MTLPPVSVLAPRAASSAPETIGTPLLWGTVLLGVVALLALDFLLTRKPHAVSMREAVGWSVFYVALPLAFGGYVLLSHGQEAGLEYLTGYVVEKSLSIDNLFVFLLVMGGFAVPRPLQQRVLLYGIVGALVLRGVFIALGAAALARFDWMFLVFGVVLVATGVKILRDALAGHERSLDVASLRSVRLLRRLLPVTDEYDGPRLATRAAGRWALTPLAVVVVALFSIDVVFAVDSVPAVYGITGDPFLVFATNAFALMGLRALYFVVEGAVSRLRHLGFGLAVILGFIGTKLALHWAHLRWDAVPEIPTLGSLGVIVGVLGVTTVTSLVAGRSGDRDTGVRAEEHDRS